MTLAITALTAAWFTAVANLLMIGDFAVHLTILCPGASDAVQEASYMLKAVDRQTALLLYLIRQRLNIRSRIRALVIIASTHFRRLV